MIGLHIRNHAIINGHIPLLIKNASNTYELYVSGMILWNKNSKIRNVNVNDSNAIFMVYMHFDTLNGLFLFHRCYINIFVETEEIGSFILYTSRIDNVGPSSVIANTHYYMLYTIYRSQGNFEM